MQFNNAIPILSRPKYAEGTKLSSERDDRNNSQLWKKGKASAGQIDSLSQAVQKLSREVAKQRRRIVGGYEEATSTTVENLNPFTIYQAPSIAAVIVEEPGSGYSEGDLLTVDGGTGSSQTTMIVTSVNLIGAIIGAQIQTVGNYTTYPTYPNSPTGGSGSGFSFTAGNSSLLWKAFQMKNGVIGARSRYFLYGYDIDNNPNPFPYADNWMFGSDNFYGNGEVMIPVLGDIFNSITSESGPTEVSMAVRLKALEDTVVGGIDSNGNWYYYPQVVGCELPLSYVDAVMAICFWIEINDDLLLGFGATLKARMCGGFTASQPPMQSNFPVGPNIIPIGIASAGFNQDGTTFEITPQGVTDFYQKLSGHTTSRFPFYGGPVVGSTSGGRSFGDAIGQAAFVRGKWTEDGLSGQVFYPGDIVMDDSSELVRGYNVLGGSGSVEVRSYGVYICAGNNTVPGRPFWSDEPPGSDHSRWTLLSNKII
jgi:hypothetical protein